MDRAPASIERVLAGAPSRTRADLRQRWRLVRRNWLIVVQGAVAAALALAVDDILLDHATPYFAPIAALATVATSLAGRLRTSVQFLLGNAIGIGLADLIIARIGTGYWQLALVVAFALASALFAGGSRVIIIQAGSSAILIATATPPTAQDPWNTGRVADVLIGGVVGIAVSALLFPLNPVRHARRVTEPLLGVLADGYAGLAEAVVRTDLASAQAVLQRLRATQPIISELQAGLDAGDEAARISPLRWGYRGDLGGYAHAARHLDNALRNQRVLARQAIAALSRAEPVPPGITAAMRELSAAARSAGPALARDPAADQCARSALAAVHAASTAAGEPSGLFTIPMVAQIRMSAADLMMAIGVDEDAAHRMIREVGDNRPTTT